MCVGPSTCFESCRCTCEVGILLWLGRWNNVANSMLLRIFLVTVCGKKRNIYAVTNSSIFFVSANVNPLNDGESNKEKAATTFFNSVCDLTAVFDDTTTRMSTSY